MDSSEQTSWDLREKVIPVKAAWWQSVEIITPLIEPYNSKWPNLRIDDYSFKPKLIFCCLEISRSGNDLVVLKDNDTSSVMYLKDACEIMDAENREAKQAFRARQDQLVKEHEEYKQQREFLNYAHTLDQYYNYDIRYCAYKVKNQFGQSLHPKVIEELKIEAEKASIRKKKKQYDIDSQNPQIRAERLLEKQNEMIKRQTEEITKKMDYQTQAILRNKLNV